MAEHKLPLEPRDCAGLSLLGGGVFVLFALLTGNMVLGFLGIVFLLAGFVMFWHLAAHG